MKGYQNINSTVGCPLKLLFECFLNYLLLSCQKKKNENFHNFNILAYEILVTTDLIELKCSGIREGVNKLGDLKFQSNLISLRKNAKIWNSGKLVP